MLPQPNLKSVTTTVFPQLPDFQVNCNGLTRGMPGYRSNQLMTDAPITKNGLIEITSWLSDYTHYKVRDEIIYPFPRINGEAGEVWEWIIISFHTL